MLIVSKTHLHEMQSHGQAAYPFECCGALLGSQNIETQERLLTKTVRIENESKENKHRRFEIKTDDYKYVEEMAMKEQSTLIGFYHTHPDHPAQPSSTDLEYAWPYFSYVIISLEKGIAKEVNSFALSLDENQFRKEQLRIVPE